MNDTEIWKLLGQSGIAVGALIVLARIVYRVGERMILAIDKVTEKIEAHTKADTAALAAVGVAVGDLRQDIAVLAERVDTVIDWGERTPTGFVESLPVHRASTRDVTRELDRPASQERLPRPGGEYSFRRPPADRDK